MASVAQIIHPAGVPNLRKDKKENNLFLQTAINDDDDDGEDEVFILPNIKQKLLSFRQKRRCSIPVVKKKTGVLEGLTFQPPCTANVVLASRYRMAILHRTETNSTLPARHHVKRVQRRRKTRAWENARPSLFLTEQPPGSDDKDDDEWSDYDFDGEFDDDYEFSPAQRGQKVEILSQTMYKNYCRNLRIHPSGRFYNSLVSDVCIVKHQILHPKGVKACATALLSNPFITKLHLEENEMGPEGARYIAELLPENTSITDLTLSENKIGTEGLKAIANVMKTHERIRRLDLSGNGFDEFDAEYISDIIENNTVLQELVLRHNRFREAGGVTIGTSLGLTDSLRVLNLSWNHLRRRGIIAICDYMELNHSIESLDLSWNGFAMEGCKAMSKAIRVNHTLKEFDISSSRVNYSCLVELLKGLSENRSLEVFRLSENPISTEGAMAILQVLKNKKSLPLKELDIAGQCVDSRFMHLLDEIRQNRKLVVHHGAVFLKDLTLNQGQDTSLDKEHPMMVLMECMRLQNLRLVDLFTSLDKDGSKSLEHAEFKDGLLGLNIPMTPGQIDNLIKNLDIDGDGEVDFQELLAGQREYKKKLHKMKQRDKNVAYEDTEIGRINTKLRTLMAQKQRRPTIRDNKSLYEAPGGRRKSVAEHSQPMLKQRRNTTFGLPNIQAEQKE